MFDDDEWRRLCQEYENAEKRSKRAAQDLLKPSTIPGLDTFNELEKMRAAEKEILDRMRIYWKLPVD